MSEKTVPTLKLGDVVVVGNYCYQVKIDPSRLTLRAITLVELGDAEDAEALAKNARELEAIHQAAAHRKRVP